MTISERWINIRQCDIPRLDALLKMSNDALIAGHLSHGFAIDDLGNLWCRLPDESGIGEGRVPS
jgi:hypothetical protein